MAGLYPHTGYGPTDNYSINSSQPYAVKIDFFVNVDSDGWYVDMAEIETTLTQGTRSESFKQSVNNDCKGIYDNLFWRLYAQEMSMAISSYNVGSHSDIATQCVAADYECKASEAWIKNIHW